MALCSDPINYAFLDTAQRDLVEAQASSGKAPCETFFWTLRNDLVEAQVSSGKSPPRVTAQHALLEAQASSVKAPSFVCPCSGRDEPMGNRDRECPCYKPCFVRMAYVCELPLGRYSGPIRYCVQKLAIFTMVMYGLY